MELRLDNVSQRFGRSWCASLAGIVLLYLIPSSTQADSDIPLKAATWQFERFQHRLPFAIPEEPGSAWSPATSSTMPSQRAVAQTSEVREPSGTADPSRDTGEERVRKPPSAEAIYQEVGALFDRRFTLEAGFSYARFERATINLSGFLALDAIFLGTISVDNVESDILTFDILGRWGLRERLQVDLAAPFLYRRTKFQSGGVGGDPNIQSEEDVTLDPDFQLGDISAGLYYQLRAETATRPDIVWNIRLKAPTGEDPYGVKLLTDPTNDNLTFPEELPSGNGVWTLSTGLSFIKTIDPAILFADVSLFYNFEESFSDISSTLGTKIPGKVDLGDSLQYGLGIAFALSERMSLAFSYTQRFVEKTRTKESGGQWISVIGSDANVATLNVGVTYAMKERLTMITNLGTGLTDDAADVQLTMKFSRLFD